MQAIIRPPSEAYSFILLAMLGCSNNTCTFCPSYKQRNFSLRSTEEVIKEFDNNYREEEKVFLADGDAVVIPNKDLVKILKHIKKQSTVKRISSYITPKTALNKSLEELKELKQAGLDLVYLGVETGDNQLLKDIKKNVTSNEMTKAGKKIREAKIKLSVTIILGLAGKENSLDHAKETASLLNQIQPDYVGALTLMIAPGTVMYTKLKSGEFNQLSTFEYLQELYWIMEDLDLKDCIFRSNHASNYFSVAGTLPEDKKLMLDDLKNILENKNKKNLKPEFLRGL